MLRLILSPRWMLWHLLTLSAMATCLALAGWQWQRAGSAMGSALNVGYGLQWPMFAIFFGVMWWRFLRMELARLPAQQRPERPSRTRAEAPPEPVGSPRPGPSPFGPRPASAAPPAVPEDSALAAYNRMLAELATRTPED